MWRARGEPALWQSQIACPAAQGHLRAPLPPRSVRRSPAAPWRPVTGAVTRGPPQTHRGALRSPAAAAGPAASGSACASTRAAPPSRMRQPHRTRRPASSLRSGSWAGSAGPCWCPSHSRACCSRATRGSEARGRGADRPHPPPLPPFVPQLTCPARHLPPRQRPHLPRLDRGPPGCAGLTPGGATCLRPAWLRTSSRARQRGRRAQRVWPRRAPQRTPSPCAARVRARVQSRRPSRGMLRATPAPRSPRQRARTPWPPGRWTRWHAAWRRVARAWAARRRRRRRAEEGARSRGAAPRPHAPYSGAAPAHWPGAPGQRRRG
mmetsp:Transcript_10610/g.31450  ORF Transcript_10610/g.31450 Transcript_10610/m.31450 type:complete len:321 (-) Transcript_10610:294-1256(-)